MRRFLRMLTFLALAALAGWASAEVTVTFADAAAFSDMNTDNMRAADTERAITDHLRQLGERFLGRGELLSVRILDVDLAGNDEWLRRAPFRIRVARESTWPRLQLSYTLTRDGAVVAHGEETIADLNYLHRLSRYDVADPYRYEKQLLDDWFRQRFAGRG